MLKVVHPLWRLRSGLTGTLVLFLSSIVLTACIVTADQSIESNPKDPRAQDIADRVLFMEAGRIVADGTPRQILVEPDNERTRRFLNRVEQR